jgi:hypothetical protein
VVEGLERKNSRIKQRRHCSIPLNDDDVLTINASISAYTSASLSNIVPLSGDWNRLLPTPAHQSILEKSRQDI